MTVPSVNSLARVLEDLAGDTGLLAQLADAYLADLDATVSGILEAERDGQPKHLAQWVHRLHGSFAVLHADDGRALAAAIERQLATGEMPPARAVRDLVEAAHRLGAALGAWRSGHPV